MKAAGRIDPDAWTRDNLALLEGAFAEPAGPATSVAEWVASARIATGEERIELAASFQRHLTRGAPHGGVLPPREASADVRTI